MLALLAVCLWRLLRLSLPGWLAGLRRGQTAPWLVLAVVCHAQGDWLRVARGAGISTEAAVGPERMPASLRVPERSSR